MAGAFARGGPLALGSAFSTTGHKTQLDSTETCTHAYVHVVSNHGKNVNQLLDIDFNIRQHGWWTPRCTVLNAAIAPSSDHLKPVLENAVNKSGNAVLPSSSEALSADGFMDPLLLPQLSFQQSNPSPRSHLFFLISVHLAFCRHSLGETGLVNTS